MLEDFTRTIVRRVLGGREQFFLHFSREKSCVIIDNAQKLSSGMGIYMRYDLVLVDNFVSQVHMDE